MRIDWRRHGDHEEVAASEIKFVHCVREPRREAYFLRSYLTGSILSVPQLFDTRLIDVETEDGKLACKVDGKWQADIAQSNHTNAHIFKVCRRRMAH